MTYRGTKLALTKENALDLLRKKPKAPTKKLVEQAPKVVSKVQVQNQPPVNRMPRMPLNPEQISRILKISAKQLAELDYPRQDIQNSRSAYSKVLDAYKASKPEKLATLQAMYSDTAESKQRDIEAEIRRQNASK